MLDGISMIIEEGGVPVTDGLVTFGGMVRQTDVTTGHIQFTIVPRQNDGRCLKAPTVMGFPTFGKIHNHGVIEHRAFALRHRLEAFDNAGDLFDLTNTDFLPDFVTGNSAVTSAMSKGMDRNEITLVTGQSADGS